MLLEMAARSNLDQDPTPTYSCTFTTRCDFCPAKSYGILGGNCCWVLSTLKHVYLETAAFCEVPTTLNSIPAATRPRGCDGGAGAVAICANALHWPTPAAFVARTRSRYSVYASRPALPGFRQACLTDPRRAAQAPDMAAHSQGHLTSPHIWERRSCTQH